MGFPSCAVALERFDPFEVFTQHQPMGGARVALRLSPTPGAMSSLIESRAAEVPDLDPDLAQRMVRAGLGVVLDPSASFVYATAEEAFVLLREGVTARAGGVMRAHDELLSRYVARLARLLGQEVPVRGAFYEFPDLTVFSRALVFFQEAFEEGTLARCATWLGAQMRGRGQSFHPSMIETLEEQTSVLESAGIDLDALPGWWWRGVAARPAGEGGGEILEPVPAGDALSELVYAAQ